MGPCLHFPRQAQFHVLKYVQGLLQAIQKHGGQIFCDTHVTDFEDGAPCKITTKSGAEVSSQALVVATCTPINNRFMIHTKQAAYRTYAIAAKGSIPKGLYWDTEDPYHYVRTHGNWLIVGGEDHKTGQDAAVEANYNHLETWAKKRFSTMGNVEYRWSGQIFEPIDSLGFIGRNPRDKYTYIATGDAGNGITHGTIAGLLIPDLISGKENLWESLYAPSRKTLSAASTYIQENLNTAAQYGDWFTPGKENKIEELLPEEGIILRAGLKKIAVYKDEHSKVHTLSAYCPHLGGCVRWNSGEKTWDCPCHGSRFDGCGEVLVGPAVSPLTAPHG